MRMLARSGDAIVTAQAGSRADTGVIEYRRGPGAGGMAIIALVGAGDMQRVFSGGIDTIVTRLATAENLGVIHHKRR